MSTLTAIPTRPTARTAAIAALPVSFAGRAVAGWGRRLAGADRAEVSAEAMERNAEQLFAVLGRLKGGAMKVGQALSVYEPMIPAGFAGPYREALEKLQDSAPTMPAREVHRVLAGQLGRDWPRRFREFSDTPAAAASVGQVHRAVWHDGREVAVKVQYPGAADALDADLRTLQRFAGLFSLLAPALDARAVLAELRSRMLDELDYRAEADRQRTFAAGLEGDLVAPRVVASAPTVIVGEWLDGVPLRDVLGAGGCAATRDRYAHAIVETVVSSPARFGLLHADPHPGNVLVLRDGRLALIDFGAVAELPGGFPPGLARLLTHLADGDAAAMLFELKAQGFAGPGVTADEVLRYVGALADPLRHRHFHLHREWLRRQGERMVDPRGRAFWETGRRLALPPEHLLVVRVLSGWLNILAQLDCTVGLRGLAQRWVPGFTPVA
ncbi:AarF/ABC1/UbiB kinase family protein [Pseudonocardia sp. WMMC193]|uniref:ABC1 kinase family protein n=1 Tax=Pseudonocardia sp. WMMC193 TaxID=2911965 RepID=UPI001F22227F|nr:AarF/UbiB family protein [Pseudonocardia sp. WMMC193]MCF7547673.1 AarF/UbiB family protein [Pseudonocardia sp. WMMC193]